jgi:hypothetical protein
LTALLLIASGCTKSTETPANNSGDPNTPATSITTEIDAGVGSSRSAESGIPSERGGIDRPLNPEKFGNLGNQ